MGVGIGGRLIGGPDAEGRVAESGGEAAGFLALIRDLA